MSLAASGASGTLKQFWGGTTLKLEGIDSSLLPGTGYDLNLGSLQRKFLGLHAAELWVETLVAQNTAATIGGRMLVTPANMLAADAAPGLTTLTWKYNNFVNGDRIYLESNGRVEFMAIISAPVASGANWNYNVTRNLDGSGADQWYAGDAAVVTNSFIDLYSVRGVKAATEVGPTIVGNVRNSTTYNDWSPRWAIGRLDNLYGYTSTSCGGAPCFGSVFGVANGARMTMDPTNGIRMYDGTNIQRVTITPAGSATFDGAITVGTGRNVLRNSECRVGTEDWVIGANNTGLTPTFSFNYPGYRLLNESNTCYITHGSGTPASGTYTLAYNTQKLPVIAGRRYEMSVYLGMQGGVDRARVYAHWYTADGTYITDTAGVSCLPASGPGGIALASYCRSSSILTTPANAGFVLFAVITYYNGQPNPYTFFVRGYFGEASPEQTQLTEWGPAGVTEITGGIIKTGTITADKISVTDLQALGATIAGWTITTTNITKSSTNGNANLFSSVAANTGSGSGTHAGVIVSDGVANWAAMLSGSGTEIALMVGGAAPTTAPFRVRYDGAMWATNATITGNITATSGNVINAIAAGSITSSHIAANTITAADIAAGSITTTEIAANTITAADIAAGTITGTEIAANTITAADLNVTELSAITANAGTITAGTINGVTINGSTINGGVVTGGNGYITLNSTGLHFAGSGTSAVIDFDGIQLKHNPGVNGLYITHDLTVEDFLIVNGDSTPSVDFTAADVSVSSSLQFANIPLGANQQVHWYNSLFYRYTSSRRYKENIRPLAPTNPYAVLALRPVRFDFIPKGIDPVTKKPFTTSGQRNLVGLIAEEAAAVLSDVVTRDERDQPDGIHEEAVTAYLLLALRAMNDRLTALEKRGK